MFVPWRDFFTGGGAAGAGKFSEGGAETSKGWDDPDGIVSSKNGFE